MTISSESVLLMLSKIDAPSCGSLSAGCRSVSVASAFWDASGSERFSSGWETASGSGVSVAISLSVSPDSGTVSSTLSPSADAVSSSLGSTWVRAIPSSASSCVPSSAKALTAQNDMISETARVTARAFQASLLPIHYSSFDLPGLPLGLLGIDGIPGLSRQKRKGARRRPFQPVQVDVSLPAKGDVR